MKLCVFIDGTWNDISSKTNVWKLKQDVVTSKASDVFAHYVEGPGTLPATKLSGGLFAADLVTPLSDADRWIAKKVLNAGRDETIRIYLFGFSRGAFIAHALSWLLSEIGLPETFADAVPIASAYADKDDKQLKRLTEKGMRCSPEIAMMGLLDTVSSLFDRYQNYHDGERARCVRYIYHAMAADERRVLFNVMHYRSEPRIRQRWFSGVHKDVGGGYPEAECELSNITLNWIKRRAEFCGLTFKTPSVVPPRKYDLSSLKKIHNEETGVEPTANRVFQLNDVIDRSVRDRVAQSEYFPCLADVPAVLLDWLKGSAITRWVSRIGSMI